MKREKHHSTLARAAKDRQRDQKNQKNFQPKQETEAEAIIRWAKANSATDQATDQGHLRLRQNAFLAVKEAKERGDQSFLDELSAYADSKTDLPADFLPGQGRGRKVAAKGDIIALLDKVELGPNGKIKNIKSVVEMSATTKQCRVELVRFCKNLVRDLESDPSPAFSKYGFRQGQLPLFQKARRIGMHYTGNSTRVGRAHQACSPVKLRDN